ncbi:MAG: ATP-dependent Clp protease adaptor ClpS [Muribaculaceae bacterium]|nr:ATP-dependent Clp protease adaptor ClpS [Muribaculaceae bacterium]MBR1727161.1 ATP-dependent Clp protease adaptor ClpS [Muribaculaceae bacterium]
MAKQGQQQSATGVRERIKVKEPRQYQVVMHNDDFTTMDFVVDILKAVFGKEPSEAMALMLAIHHAGKAVVGVYTYDIAASKAEKAMAMARDEGFPLRCTTEPI